MPGAFPTLVLASASPRRRELLERLGFRFGVRPAKIDEGKGSGESAHAYVLRLAVEKARLVSAEIPEAIILGADTAVVLNREILGKPRDATEAVQMLRKLAGRAHTVLTAIAVCGPIEDATVVSTRVQFRTLLDEEIAWYVKTKEPFDKAGAYAVQGIGSFLVQQIEGSFSNVVGLPLAETLQMLGRSGMKFPWSPR